MGTYSRARTVACACASARARVPALALRGRRATAHNRTALAHRPAPMRSGDRRADAPAYRIIWPPQPPLARPWLTASQRAAQFAKRAGAWLQRADAFGRGGADGGVRCRRRRRCVEARSTGPCGLRAAVGLRGTCCADCVARCAFDGAARMRKDESGRAHQQQSASQAPSA
jgi:hypothetical protein